MIINKNVVHIVFLLFFTTNVHAQSYSYFSKIVLQSNKINKVYHYTTNDSVDLYITIIGKVKTGNKQIKLLTIRSIIPSNGYGYLWIYDNHNRYIGRYILGGADDLPIGFRNGYLIFSNKQFCCKTVSIKKISFNNVIPKKIFVPGCEGNGDFVEFRTDQ